MSCSPCSCSQKKVAIIGLMPPDTAVISSPGPLVAINSIESTLPGCIADAKEDGATMIVLLSHVSLAVLVKLVCATLRLVCAIPMHCASRCCGDAA